MPSNKKVCIIGGGAAGLAAAKHSINHGLDAQIFEQTSQIGGTWVYSEQRGCHSSMYQDLKTNLPKEVMQFKDVPFRDELPSFLSHEDVLEYLEDFANRFAIPIQFNCKVENVKPLDNGQWEVTSRCTTDPELELPVQKSIFDIVFVCNGHYSQPNNPYAENDFEGQLIHSHDYRRADEFRDKNVTVIGAGPSGIDIALQLADTAKKITLISRKATYKSIPSNIHQIPCHVANITKTGCITEEGSEIEADAIIVCTGYFYKFPFLSDDVILLKENHQMVSPIFEHVVHAKFPKSLFFIGLNLVTITFPLFEYQVKMALSFALGKATIPSDDTLINFESTHIQHQKTERGLDARFYHLLQNEQWEYLRRIAKLGGFPEWEYMKTIENITSYLQEERKRNVIGYKKINFKLSDDKKDYKVIGCE